MKPTNITSLMLSAICLVGISTSNVHAQKRFKKLAQTITNSVMPPHIPPQAQLKKIRLKIETTTLRAQVEQFVAQQGRWPRASQAPEEEMLLAKQVNRFIWEHEKTTEPTRLALQQLRQTTQQAELENQILLQLETFTNEHAFWPRREIRAVTGALNRVEDMSAEQIAEFKLARQLEYILAKAPNSATAQKIQALKEKWNK